MVERDGRVDVEKSELEAREGVMGRGGSAPLIGEEGEQPARRRARLPSTATALERGATEPELVAAESELVATEPKLVVVQAKGSSGLSGSEQRVVAALGVKGSSGLKRWRGWRVERDISPHRA